ncbi:hypothetical protein J4481_02295 [Candidatus Pacearchaeota archaeon]|nr:hypothetical protein [uncultured archaeon]MBS3076548.1 hypothetical protein [Candidatus Pacearchaeota archaeon]
MGKKDALNKVVSILIKRYEECNEGGHKKLNEEENICDYCYRRLEYETPRTDEKLREQGELPPIFQPVNAVQLDDEREEESGYQKVKDFFAGLSKLEKELSQPQK